MSEFYPTFPIGSVGYNLMLLRGTWHDHVELFELDGQPLGEDTAAGSPGPSPFENLVYIDFDGQRLALTNVHLRGRALSAKTFTGQLRDGLLVFDSLGPGAYENVGMSGGPGVLTFTARQLGKVDRCLHRARFHRRYGTRAAYAPYRAVPKRGSDTHPDGKRYAPCADLRYAARARSAWLRRTRA